MNINKSKSSSLMHRICEFIVDKRNFIFLAVIACVIFSLFSSGWVKVQNDLTSFLPDKSESKEGYDVMMDEFTLFGSAQVMVANITVEKAWELKSQLENIDGIQMVDFGEDSAHYNNASACFSITFAYAQNDARCEDALDEVKALLSGYDNYLSSDIGNPMGAILDNEIMLIIIVAVIIIIAMLLLTSKSVIELPIVMITFGAAMMINMGTNFVFGEISFVSNSVTSLLQLALSLDYAVILINRFREEYERRPLRDAVVEALSKAVPEVFGSSLTTIGGLAAMTCMQFKLGPDMGICLIKAVMFAMLSVFIVMPGLLVIFGKALKKTEHKMLLPKVSFIGKFAYKSRKIVAPLFAVVVIAAMVISGACPFSYGYTSQETTKMNEQTLAKKMISENFGSTNMLALIVPSGDYETEAKLLADLEAREEVDSTMGLANIEAMNGYTLASGLTPRQFSELADLDYEIACGIYTAYATSNEDIGALTNISSYEIPLIDIFMFVSELIDTSGLSLEGEQAEMLSSAKDQMQSAKDMLIGENYNRMVVYINLPEDGEETFAFLEEMRAMAKGYYPDGEVYIIGGATTAKDFKESFVIDNTVVAVVSIVTVLLVLLLSFKSIAMPIILILVIQGAIWINFSIPTLLETPLFFLGYIIISAIQMGANIDYAIVIATRYNEMKKELPSRRDAIIDTMNFAFPTVITSGTIMSVAGLLIGNMSSEATISSLGANLGRGTIISMILVLFVLPQLLLVSDKLVDKTSFKIFKKKEEKKAETNGKIRVCGIVNGQIEGKIEGVIDAVVDGKVNLNLISAEISEEKEENSSEK